MAKKTRNYFRENRIRVQQAIYNQEYVIPLTTDDLPFIIREEKNKKDELKLFKINNIPTNDINPKSWVIDLEIQKSIFSAPEGVKKAEKAIAFLTKTSLYVLLFELKDSLRNLDDIKKKFEDSISRISLLVTHYIFGATYNDLEIKYFGYVCYNNNKTETQLIHKQPSNVDYKEMYDIFIGKSNHSFLNDQLGGVHRVIITFIKNTHSNPAEMTIDLDEIFKDDMEYENGQYAEFTCPILKNLPTDDC
jgi:hypothetical protein